MRAVTEVHALKVERAFVDFQLFGVVRAVQKHADSALIDTGGIFVGQLAVGIHRREGEVTAAQHSRAVPGQHRAAARLRNGFQHWSGNVVGVGTVNELDIIHQDIARDLCGHRRCLDYTEGISAVYIDGHLHGRNISLHPNPAFTGHIAQSSQHNFISLSIGILAIILGIHCRSFGNLAFLSIFAAPNVSKATIGVQYIIAAIGFCFCCTSHTACHNRLQKIGAMFQIFRNIDPHTNLGRLHSIHI